MVGHGDVPALGTLGQAGVTAGGDDQREGDHSSEPLHSKLVPDARRALHVAVDPEGERVGVELEAGVW